MKKASITMLCITLLITLCSCNATTANFTSLKMSSEVGADNQPLKVSDTFAKDTPMLNVTGILSNVPVGTKIKAQWRYVEQEPAVEINSEVYDTKEANTAFHFSLSKPTNGWPAGKYEVKLFIDGIYKKSLDFKVE